MISALLIVLSLLSQAPKSVMLHGTVKKVDAAAKRVSIENEAIPGGMGTMTMDYPIDPEEMLARLKPGDHITAKFAEGDPVLHDVRLNDLKARAEPAPGMKLEELERLALANNPTVAQAEANLRASTGRARQSSYYPNPTIGYYGDEIRGGYTGGGKQGAFISQNIVTGGKLRAARRVADLTADQSRTTQEMQRLRVLNNVRTSYYEVLAAQRLVEVREKLSGLSTDATQTSYQLANVGQADKPDVLQAEVEQQQAAIGLRVARQNLQSSWRMLAAVAGKPDLPLARLEGDLEAIPELNYEEWVANTLRDSPEVKLAQQGIARAEASLVQAKKAPIPDLQLTANLSQNNEPLETTHKPIGLNGGVQLGVQIPIFNRNQGNIAAAKDEMESARQELARVKLQIAQNLAGLFRDYESARITAQQYKTEMLPRAQQAYQLYRSNYQKMAASYPQAIISQRTLFQLEADYVQALENAWQSALGIRGFALMNGLAMPALPASTQ